MGKKIFAIALAATSLSLNSWADPAWSDTSQIPAAEKLQITKLAMHTANQIACNPQMKKALLVDSQASYRVYLILWETDVMREMAGIDPQTGACLGGSGTSQFGLTRIILSREGLSVSGVNLFSQLDTANHIDNRVGYESQPKAVNTRFIQSINVVGRNRIMLVADGHSYNSHGNNFPGRRWRYEISIPSMRILRTEFICDLDYKSYGTVCK